MNIRYALHVSLPRTTAGAVILTVALLAGFARAEQHQPFPARKPQGTAHAFLVIRSETRAVLGYGEFSQHLSGEHVMTRLTLSFRDGSVDEDTTVFTQRPAFHLIRDHHTQRGPFFSKATDALLEENGDYTLRVVEKDGKEKVETSHIDLPPDVSNGITGAMLLSVQPDAPPFKLSMVAPSGKGRLIDLSISTVGKEPFTPVLGVRRKATVFQIHPELGGLAGVIAPVIGKQPKDIFIWILEGEAPGLVREIGPLEQGGPVVSVEPAGANYPAAAKLKK